MSKFEDFMNSTFVLLVFGLLVIGFIVFLVWIGYDTAYKRAREEYNVRLEEIRRENEILGILYKHKIAGEYEPRK